VIVRDEAEPVRAVLLPLLLRRLPLAPVMPAVLLLAVAVAEAATVVAAAEADAGRLPAAPVLDADRPADDLTDDDAEAAAADEDDDEDDANAFGLRRACNRAS
jgi:hypothetical protein